MPTADTEYFIRIFRKYRLALLAAFVIGTVLSTFFFRSRVLKYQGTAIFYVTADPRFPNEVPYRSLEGSNNRWQVTRSHERILQFAYSERLYSHLIKTFDLYRQYGIDTSVTGHEEVMYGILGSIIEISKINLDIFRVSITDRNREMAAEMANSVVSYLDQMNREFIYNSLQKELNAYKSFIDESKKRIELQHVRIDSTVSALQMMATERAFYSKDEFQRAVDELRETGHRIADLTEGEMNTYFIYNDILKAADFNQNKSIVMIRKALPDSSSKEYFLVLYGVMGGFFVAFIALAIAYLSNYYNWLIVSLFGK